LKEELVDEDFEKETQAAIKAALLVVENLDDKTSSLPTNETIDKCKMNEKPLKIPVEKSSDSLKNKTPEVIGKKKIKRDVEEGKTLHIRGLSLSVSKEQIAEYLKPFGEIVYVRLVKKNTGILMLM
jgi:RNA recognition motif-containing protein